MTLEETPHFFGVKKRKYHIVLSYINSRIINNYLSDDFMLKPTIKLKVFIIQIIFIKSYINLKLFNNLLYTLKLI